MDILVIHSLYIPYIFPKYVPLSSMYFPLCVSSFMESRVGPDIIEVRLLVKFHTFRIQNLLSEVIFGGFCMVSSVGAQKTRFLDQKMLHLIQKRTWTRTFLKSPEKNR